MKDKRNRHSAVGLQNNIFVNVLLSPLLCEISKALHLVQTGLTTGRLADEIQMNFKNFRIYCRLTHLTFCFVEQVYSIIIAVPMHSSKVF